MFIPKTDKEMRGKGNYIPRNSTSLCLMYCEGYHTKEGEICRENKVMGEIRNL
jgi:hypothetical protein